MVNKLVCYTNDHVASYIVTPLKYEIFKSGQ